LSDWLNVIILGIVEGITEFLPISSTGHLIVAKDLLNFDAVPPDLFEIFIQFGAVVAVVVYYAPDLWRELRAIPTDKSVQQFWLAILVATLPAIAIGVLFGDEIRTALFSPAVVALALIAGGIAFIVIERYYLDKRSPLDENATVRVTLRQALIIGLCQLIALVPGMSRSGMSILGGMAAGLPRQAATRFSFYLAIPLLGGATVYSLVKSLSDLNSTSLLYLLVGAVVSGFVAWLSIAWLLRYVSRNTFIPFGYYRILAGTIILVLIVMRIL
jgi:undecaprenyl-diphosphatase